MNKMIYHIFILAITEGKRYCKIYTQWEKNNKVFL